MLGFAIVDMDYRKSKCYTDKILSHTTKLFITIKEFQKVSFAKNVRFFVKEKAPLFLKTEGI